MSDILSIEAQLNHVRADIESMEGRLTYLRNQVAYSTLTLSFIEPVGVESGLGSKAVAAFADGWDMLLVFILGMIHIWPFLLMTPAVLLFVWKRKTRKKVDATAPGS